MKKKVLITATVILLLFAAGRMFNHADPWAGILLAVAVAGIVIYKLIKKIKDEIK